MRINIASSGGRFHLLDLARELEKYGHEIRFYSYVPHKRALRFGLKPECDCNYFWVYLPFHFLLRVTHRAGWALYLFHRFFDYYTAWRMKPCDVFIAHSPMHVYAIEYARRKYGAKIILERGTSHVLTQIKALEQNPANKGKCVMPDMFLKRDLKGYDLADYIAIASEHVYNSFVENGIEAKKLFRNPYGANLSKFHPTELDTSGNVYDVLMVGQWCHRKGCDLLYQACEELKLKFLHVGTIVDLPFAQTEYMNHHDAVDEMQLIQFYKQARIFALPSREEGLAMVQPQAMLSGLPLVCSRFSGGKDLRDMLTEDNRKWVVVMSTITKEELKRCLLCGLELAYKQRGVRNYVGHMADQLTWEAYGKRYNDFLLSITK